MPVQCELCPKECLLDVGESGNCRIRANVDGELTALTYGFPSALHVDPVEKKPLFHFLPGSKAFSIATVGCNLHCRNCQNWEISQCDPEDARAYKVLPKQLISLARKQSCQSIAYTYTDPVAYYEYTYDSAILARKAGVKNILVTAGYINKQPMKDLCQYIDAANIDLKAYSDKFYRDICDATLKPVLEALVTAKKAGVMVEITNLLIPTLNDKDDMIKDLCKWVRKEMGDTTPLHFSRFFPRYQMRNLPATPAKTLDRARQIAKSEGLKHVYIGNILREGAEDTHCPKCNALLVQRKRYTIQRNRIKNGRCPDCNERIYGVWE